VKSWTLFFLRVTLAAVLVVWGADKVLPPTQGALWVAVGVLEIGLGFGLAMGVYAKWLYPAVCAVTGLTHASVWRSIIAPPAANLGGSDMLLFPSFAIFAAALVLAAFRDEDRFTDTPNEKENH
jgi:putative oxidoreductase